MRQNRIADDLKRCRHCHGVYHSVALINGLCGKCRWDIKLKKDPELGKRITEQILKAHYGTVEGSQ